MKMRRLAETDLARYGVMESIERRQALRLHKFGRPPHVYAPVRAAQADILNRETPLFGLSERATWEQVVHKITRLSAHASELEYNLAVAKALYGFAVERKVFSREQAFLPWAVGFGQSVSYWQNYLSIFDGQAEIAFHDYRITRRLNRNARRFVFSVMHERIRAVDEDMASLTLAIYQFGKLEDGTRVLRRHTDTGVSLFSAEELNAMISETYQTWREVLEEREEDTRRTGTGPANPMGF